jgi:hypothetical protein
MSTFEEQFPSIPKKYVVRWDRHDIDAIERFCLDKQKVREAFIKQIEEEEKDLLFKSPMEYKVTRAEKRMKELGL